MIDDRALDPAGVIRQILANGPLAAPEFRRQAHAQGIPIKNIGKAAKAAGAECRRQGLPGEGGWVWMLSRPDDDGIINRPGRSGFHAHFFRHGQEVQQKLGDTIEEARVRMAELKKQLDEEARHAPPRPRPASPRRKKVVIPLHEQLREVARQMLRLSRTVKALEAQAAKNTPPSAKGDQP